MKNIKKLILSEWLVGLVITCAFVGLFIFQWQPLQLLEFRTYDLRARMMKYKPASPIVIVAIDEYSLDMLKGDLGRWPWPRKYMAALIDRLTDAGAKVIGLELLFPEPQVDAGQAAIGEIKAQIEGIEGYINGKNKELVQVHDLMTEKEGELDNDAILEASMAVSNNVILPMFFETDPQFGNNKVDEHPGINASSMPYDGASKLIDTQRAIMPIPLFVNSVIGLGHDNLYADADGTVRRGALLIKYGGRAVPSFPLALTLKYLNYRLGDVQLTPDGMTIGDRTLMTDESKQMLLRFAGSVGSFQYVPFSDIVYDKVSMDTFRGKIVLVGVTASGVSPLSVTPMGPSFPSIEVQANIIDGILNQQYLTRPAWASKAEIGVMVLFGLVISFLIPRLKALGGAIVAFALLGAWLGACVYLFVAKGLWLKMLSPAMLMVAGYIVLVTTRFMVTEKKKEKVETESVETNKMLGLSFQSQGMLDLALEKFMKCPIDDDSIKEAMYNLALDFERKRMFNKAVSVYQHIKKAGEYKDIDTRMEKLIQVGETMIFGASGGGLGGGKKDGTMLVQGAATLPTLGRYEVQKELGRGAMGIVYLGKDPKINRSVAIKTVRFEEIDESMIKEVKERFFREAEAAGKLAHPNIVTIYDAGEDMDLAYVAMELLDGRDLSDFLEKQPGRKVQPKLALKIVGTCADALGYAHKNGIVHRDVKPANIMLLKNGVIKVTDFGIARVVESSKTQTGVVLGTPSYMSPEQVVGKKVDGRSDIFSLGVMFYEMIAGKKPFTGDSMASLMYNIANTPHTPLKEAAPDVPECCSVIADRFLEKDLEKRYQTCEQAVRDIKGCYGSIK